MRGDVRQAVGGSRDAVEAEPGGSAALSRAWRAFAVVAVAAGCVAACDDSGPSTPRRGPDASGGLPTWSLSPEPLLTIGDDPADPGAQLFGVTGATLLPSGELAVANGGFAEVWVYDVAGRRVATFGGKGGGPGEFVGMTIFLLPSRGDTLTAGASPDRKRCGPSSDRRR